MTVSESEVLEAIREGASSVDEVGQACEAGTGCQTCQPAIREMLRDQARRDLARSRRPRSLRQLTMFDELESGRGGKRKTPSIGGSHKKPS